MNSESSSGSRFQVAIIGYGPVGATLANLLGQAGIETVIIDKEAAHYHLPRAVHFDDEVMRVFQTAGLADTIAKTLRVNPGMRFVDDSGKLLLDWPRPQEISQNGWYASYRFHQPDIEQILRDGLRRFDSVNVLTETEVTKVQDRGRDVSLCCRHRSTGTESLIHADFVVGCDGANSLVRKTMNVDMVDFGFNERWLVLDILLKQDKPELGDHSIQHCNPLRPATYVRGPKNRRRWEIRLNPDEPDSIADDADAVWQLVQPWISSHEGEIERSASYTFNSKVVRSWREGRLLLAGDAAHLTPPFMGQGMCAGIRDVSNLGWKLIAVIRGKASETLLDTYGTERFGNAAEYVKTAVRLGGLINTAGTEEALRAAFQSADKGGPAKMESIAPPLGPGIAAGDKTYTGRLFAQPVTLEGHKSDDELGYRTILYLDRSAFSANALEKAESANFVMFSTEQSTDLEHHLSSRNTKAVLARGDRYIVGTANSDDELIAICGWDNEYT